jgi:hypothetical protein
MRMARDAEGWHRLDLPGAAHGDSYRFELPDGSAVPDPASRFNPEDVHGPSVVIDPRRYAWNDAAWRGRPWEEAVVYELHIGAFTAEGTFNAARERLGELAELGVTAIELMPLADFPGRRNWGYDGVLQFAPDASYGTPDELKALVDAAHGLGLMVLIDVVYNHFGPEGNYLHGYCPEFFNPEHRTPWGAAINFDGPGARTVRDFFVHNALYWIEEFRFDGCAWTPSTPFATARTRTSCRRSARPCWPARAASATCTWCWRTTPTRPRCSRATATACPWPAPRNGTTTCTTPCTCWPPASATATTPTTPTTRCAGWRCRWPKASSTRASPRRFATASGAASPARGCRRRPSSRSCRRTTRWATAPSASASTRWATRCACARPWPACCCRRTCPCCSWATSSRRPRRSCTSATSGPSWPRRCRTGGARSSAASRPFKDEAARARIPDPNAESTFLASKLNWRERGARAHFEQFSEVQQLLALRHKLIVPRLAGSTGAGVFFCENDTLRVHWDLGPAGPGGSGSGSARLHMLAHFGTQQTAPLAGSPGAVVYRHGVHEEGNAGNSSLRLDHGAVFVTLEDAHGE